LNGLVAPDAPVARCALSCGANGPALFIRTAPASVAPAPADARNPLRVACVDWDRFDLLD